MAQNAQTALKNSCRNPVAEATRNGTCFTPRVDIVESDADLLLYADMPGVRARRHRSARIEQGELILHGKVQPTTPTGRLVFGEFDVGDFYRVFQVHESIDAAKIEAEFKNGVVTVRLPKVEAVKPKQVPIKVRA